ncbi:type I methionyl aminopeptidase [Shewanella cyperi]|uniref:Methionine aminopeptidase n=1 Tax=Shewanella cyperi TaxID=2814292 RepID=A0A974XJP1_9GAMM|nr:type I methionyl aminopeptidase [Shewanella cyperi]QSX29662.1 type I methionyl aminopeptidase [Shewanella cyperi]
MPRNARQQVPLKTREEAAAMRHSGALLARVFAMLDDFVRPGVSTMAINDRVEDFIVNELQARPASKGQYGYAYVLNSSVNEVVCHGVPDARQVLGASDIVNLDITLEKNGFISDSSKMYLMPDANPAAKALVQTCYQALWRGIDQVRPGARLGDIGHAIDSYARAKGYAVVEDYCGHGIGREMHEEPQVLHFGRPGTGLQLRPGMCFTIEPMLNQGSARTRLLKDGWTVVTRDKKLSAQWEHTLLVTETGCEVLTLRAEEDPRLLLGSQATHKS